MDNFKHNTTGEAAVPLLVFDRHSEGIVRSAEGHDDECWDRGCNECELHADGCPCDYCERERMRITEAVQLATYTATTVDDDASEGAAEAARELDKIREAAALEDALYANERDAMGHISSKALAESFQRLHTGLYAYDHEAGTWRRWWFGTMEGIKGDHQDVGLHVRAMLPGDTASVHKAWLNLPTFKAVERLSQAGLEGRWNADPHLIGYDNGLALDVSSATVRQVDWDSYISRYLPSPWLVMRSLAHNGIASFR